MLDPVDVEVRVVTFEETVGIFEETESAGRDVGLAVLLGTTDEELEIVGAKIGDPLVEVNGEVLILDGIEVDDPLGALETELETMLEDLGRPRETLDVGAVELIEIKRGPEEIVGPKGIRKPEEVLMIGVELEDSFVETNGEVLMLDEVEVDDPLGAFEAGLVTMIENLERPRETLDVRAVELIEIKRGPEEIVGPRGIRKPEEVLMVGVELEDPLVETNGEVLTVDGVEVDDPLGAFEAGLVTIAATLEELERLRETLEAGAVELMEITGGPEDTAGPTIVKEPEEVLEIGRGALEEVSEPSGRLETRVVELTETTEGPEETAVPEVVREPKEVLEIGRGDFEATLIVKREGIVAVLLGTLMLDGEMMLDAGTVVAFTREGSTVTVVVIVPKAVLEMLPPL